MDKPNIVPLVGHVKAYGEETDRFVSFRASTPTLDRHESIVMPLGIDVTNFKKNPIFLWAHDGYDSFTGGPSIDSVIGRVTETSATKDFFDIGVEFAGPAVNPYGEKALRMVRGKFLNTVSIGFYPKKAGWEVLDERDIYVYREIELLEVSLVPIPANPDALVISNAFNTYLGISPPPDKGADVGEQIRVYNTIKQIEEMFKNG